MNKKEQGNKELSGKPKSLRARLIGKKAPWYTKVARTLVLAMVGVTAAPFAASLLPGDQLSETDIDLYDDFYQASVDYNELQTMSTSISDLYLDVWGAEAVAIGHTIFIKSDLDTREARYDVEYIKMHELAHSWQSKNCNYPLLTIKAFFERAASVATGKGVYGHYHYQLEDGKDLLEFETEQQASILADYFSVKAGRLPYFIEEPQSWDNEEQLELYEQTLENFLEDPNYIKNHCR